MTDLLISYFEKFGDKPCCGNDLKLYLPIIQDATETARFFEKTYEMISFENSVKRPKNVRFYFINPRRIIVGSTLRIGIILFRKLT